MIYLLYDWDQIPQASLVWSMTRTFCFFSNPSQDQQLNLCTSYRELPKIVVFTHSVQSAEQNGTRHRNYTCTDDKSGTCAYLRQDKPGVRTVPHQKTLSSLSSRPDPIGKQGAQNAKRAVLERYHLSQKHAF